MAVQKEKATSSRLDTSELERKVKDMYTAVARHPEKPYHFEMGRELALKLGYRREWLDRVPEAALASFAGVGCPLSLAAIEPGHMVLDLGSGSGTDAFIAARLCLPEGNVIGLDMTRAQLTKARDLARSSGIGNVRFVEGYIEELFFDDASFDVVISNGVINLSSEKEKVFRQVARVLKPGGLLAISDIVSERPLPETVVCDASLWASCIGGAMQQDQYRQLIEGAGLRIVHWQVNKEYRFLSKSAAGAAVKYGVCSVSLLAVK